MNGVLHPMGSILDLARPYGEPRLRPTGMATFLRGVPGAREHFRDVPPRFWERTSGNIEDVRVTISCPCGQRPGLLIGESQQCDCGRIYLHLDPHVMVANSPVNRHYD